MTAPATVGRIVRLDPRTASRIAAGEVVERPVSALKELVENALDAGARSIEIRVDGGLERGFEVADDGSGMSGDELPVALERHATSKLRELDDLERLGTLGFRGEALPSIAEVSRLVVTSRTHEPGARAACLRVEAGEASPVSTASRAPGTTVSVSDLFFNVPARRKFLRSQQGELRLAVRMLTAYAVAFPDVALRLVVDGKARLDLPAATNRRDRLMALFSPHFVERLLEAREERPGVRLEAWAGVPELARVTRDGQTILVNRRWVQSPVLSQALRQGYGNLIPPARHPTGILVLDIDPASVDVNVHPTKREVRFAHENAVFSFVATTVGRPLERLAPRYLPTGMSRAHGTPPTLASLVGGNESQPTLFSGGRRPGPGSALDVRTGGGTLVGGTGAWGRAGSLRLVPPPSEAEALGRSAAESGDAEAAGAGVSESGETSELEAGAPPSARLADLWQLHQTYVLAPIAGGLLIVDQHAAHERILYEQALARFRDRETASQQLLFPLVVDLSREEFDLLLEVLSALEALGFGLSTFSPPTVVIRGVPAGLAAREPAALLRDVLDGIDDERTRDREGEPWDQVAKSYACQAAVRAGEPLNREEMNHLIDQLFATSLPHGDPHGRPTFVRVDLHELNQRFGRSD